MNDSKQKGCITVEEFEKLFKPLEPEEFFNMIQSKCQEIDPSLIRPIPFDEFVPASPRARDLKQLALFFKTILKPSREYEQVRAEIQLDMDKGLIPLEPPLHLRNPVRAPSPGKLG